MKIEEVVFDLPEERFERLAIAVFDRVRKEGGMLPPKAYFAKLQTFPTPFAEIVCVYQTPEMAEPEVLVQHRSDNDPYWPGNYSTHGITIMPRQSLSDVRRSHAIKECEVPVGATEGPMEFAGCVHLPRLEREHALTAVFVRRFTEKPEHYSGSWHKLDELPAPLMPHMQESVFPLLKEYLLFKQVTWAECLGSK